MKCLWLALLVSMIPVVEHGQSARDPTPHHDLDIPMPAQLNLRRTESQLSESFDLASLRKVRISAATGMFLGMKEEIRVYRIGDPRPPKAGRYGYASINQHGVSSEPAFLKSTNLWNRVPDGIPVPGERYHVEHHITLFETDLPAGHFWRPEAAGKYMVLWDHTLKADSR